MKFHCLSIVLTGLLTLSACVPVRQHEGAHQSFSVSEYKPVLNTVNVIDDNLQNTSNSLFFGQQFTSKISVENAGQKVTATGTRQAWALLRNRTDYPLQVEARVSWFDADQLPLDRPSAWQRLYMPANALTTYKEYSTRTDAAFFYIELREGH